MSAPHLATHQVLIGGLMRCCLETLATERVREETGEILQCKYVPTDPLHQMVFNGRVWQWNSPPLRP